MNNRDVADMAERAAEEIEHLRAINAELRPRAEAYDAICAILGLLPKASQGYGEDLAWRLRRQAAELRKPVPATPTPSADETHGDMA